MISSSSYGLTGLNNIGGASCFFNSTLQCLSNIEAFRSYVVKEKFSEDIGRAITTKVLKLDKNVKVTEELQDQIKHNMISYRVAEVIQNLWLNYPTITPESLVALFLKKFPTFGAHGNIIQSDSQEAIGCILEEIHTELAIPKAIKFPKELLEPKVPVITKLWSDYVKLKEDKKSDAKITDVMISDAKNKYDDYISKYQTEYIIYESYKYWKSYLKKEKCSFITDIFDGLFITTITCHECKKNVYKFSTTRVLPVALPEKPDTIQNCLKRYCDPEVLDGDNKYFCYNCKKKIVATKSTNIWEPSDCMIIYMTRWAKVGHNRIEKNSVNITYPLELDIGPYISDISKNRARNKDTLKKCVYKLCGVSVQTGSKDSGHYYAHCLNSFDNNWYTFNDSVVRKTTASSVIDPNATYLIYRYKS